jgi:hypothetical protein
MAAEIPSSNIYLEGLAMNTEHEMSALGETKLAEQRPMRLKLSPPRGFEL